MNFASAIQRVLAGDEIEIQYPGLLDARFHEISGFLYRLLAELDIGYLSELVLVLLKEVTYNCSKANAKRIYFEENEISFQEPTAYERGVEKFAEDVLSDWDGYTLNHQKTKYYVHLRIKADSHQMTLTVENNTHILPQEMDRINARFNSFKKYQDLNQAFGEIRDSSEGAGLGIVLSLVLLQNAGITPGNFSIQSENSKTLTTLKIPRKISAPDLKKQFKDLIISEISSLPSFPENIAFLINLCNSDTSSVHVIADHIQKDPALTAQILRLVNSAGYMSRLKNPSLLDSVKIIGLKVIRNLLMVSGARSVMDSKYKHKGLEQIWEESNRVSFFARKLASSKTSIIEHATVAGLLFELGKIVLLSLTPELLKNIDDFMLKGRIRTPSVIEEIAIGMSYAEIGSLLAEKWRFPEPLVVAIRYQEKPLQALKDYEDLIQTVYLATQIQAATEQKGSYYTVESEILEKFGIKNESEYIARVKDYDESYRQSSPGV